jgi:hypothetical protein
MTLQECTAILAPLALALRTDIDDPTFRVYHQDLRDLPGPLLQAAAHVARRDPERKFFPTVPELRALCQQCRVAILEAHPYRPGECCNGTGWLESEPNGVTFAKRCDCWRRWVNEVNELQSGRRVERAQLPAGEVLVGPAAAQSITDRAVAIVLAKTMPGADR